MQKRASCHYCRLYMKGQQTDGKQGWKLERIITDYLHGILFICSENIPLLDMKH